MSLPYERQGQLPPPAPVATSGQSFVAHHGRGSYGPVIGVLAVVVILGVVSGVIGRLCAGGKFPGLSRYDFEGWFQSKFRSCVDGKTAPPTPPLPSQENGAAGGSVPIVIPIDEPRPPKAKKQQPHPEITEL